MAENKSSISEAKSYREMGEYWDSHDLSETGEVKFEVDLQSDVFYYAVETSISSKLHSIAEKRGVSVETLVNLWLLERVNQEGVKN
jgi:hypothetical protein